MSNENPPPEKKRLNFDFDRMPSERTYREKRANPDAKEEILGSIGGLVALGIAGWLLWGMVSCALREDTPAEKAQKEMKKARTELEGEMLYICRKAIEFQANYKSNAEIDPQQVVIQGNTGFVTGSASFINGFGAMIPYKFHCDFNGRNLIKANLYKN